MAQETLTIIAQDDVQPEDIQNNKSITICLQNGHEYWLTCENGKLVIEPQTNVSHIITDCRENLAIGKITIGFE